MVHKSVQVAHWLLYVLLVVVPILGWINANWRGYPVTLFGTFELPKIIATFRLNESVRLRCVEPFHCTPMCIRACKEFPRMPPRLLRPLIQIKAFLAENAQFLTLSEGLFIPTRRRRTP